MIAPVVIVGVIAVALAGVLVFVLRMQAAERRDWASERHALVDRAIARHTGEVIALDRTPRAEHSERERPAAVGLS